MSGSLLSSLIKFSFRLEFFFPQFIRFFISRKLKEYKEKGVLADYKVRAKRKGRYHYFIELDLFVNTEKGGELHE